MTEDIERSYTGTNFVVITLAVLVFVVAVYFFFGQGEVVLDNSPTATEGQNEAR